MLGRCCRLRGVLIITSSYETKSMCSNPGPVSLNYLSSCSPFLFGLDDKWCLRRPDYYICLVSRGGGFWSSTSSKARATEMSNEATCSIRYTFFTLMPWMGRFKLRLLIGVKSLIPMIIWKLYSYIFRYIACYICHRCKIVINIKPG